MALSKAVMAATWNAPRYNGLTSTTQAPTYTSLSSLVTCAQTAWAWHFEGTF